MIDEIEAEASGPTTGRGSGLNKQVQILSRMAIKRSWTVAQKLAILDETFAPGACVSEVAERHEINTGQLYTWRQLLLDGKLTASRPARPTFARVDIAPSADPALVSVPTAVAPAIEGPAPRAGASENELEVNRQYQIGSN